MYFGDLKISTNEICLAIVKLISEDISVNGFGGRFPQIEVVRKK